MERKIDGRLVRACSISWGDHLHECVHCSARFACSETVLERDGHEFCWPSCGERWRAQQEAMR